MTRIGVGDVRISEAAIRNVNTVLASRRLTYGPFSREFERRFADLHSKRFACFVNSGTDALRIGLSAMKERYGWLPHSSVIVPALTFVASVNTVIQTGLMPRLVDIEPDFYGIDPNMLDQAYGDVAVMPVHLFGQATDPRVIQWARERTYRVIDDSCEAMFVDGIADGDVSCFSTFACHVISTGVGGIAATDEPELAELIRSYANHGRSGIYAGIDDALGNMETMAARFHFERSGYSSRATEMEAAIGCAELDDHQANLHRRRSVASALLAALSDLPLVLPKVRQNYESSSWMMFPIRCEDQQTRDSLTLFLENNDIETRPMLPLTTQPYIKKLFGDDVEDRFPVAKMVNQTGFYVGSHPGMTDADVARIDEVIHRFF